MKKQVVIFSKDEEEGTYQYDFKQAAKPIDLLMISVLLDHKISEISDITSKEVDKMKREIYKEMYGE